MKWSFSYNSFVKLSLYKMGHFKHSPIDPKYSVIKGLHCILIIFLYFFRKIVPLQNGSLSTRSIPMDHKYSVIK